LPKVLIRKGGRQKEINMGQQFFSTYDMHYRGRLVRVTVCINYSPNFERVEVVKGKPLDLRSGSHDRKKIQELVEGSERKRREIRAACAEMDRYGPW
jgi:hypothetical protein